MEKNIDELLDEYNEEARCETYNGWSRRRPAADVRKDIDASVNRLRALNEQLQQTLAKLVCEPGNPDYRSQARSALAACLPDA